MTSVLGRKSKAEKRKKTIKHNKTRYVRKKTSKHICPITQKPIHGKPHSKKTSKVRKLSKTKKRATTLLAGQVSNQARQLIIDEAIKVKYGLKELNKVDFNLKNYVKQVLGKLE